jgi:hypothetical protein
MNTAASSVRLLYLRFLFQHSMFAFSCVEFQSFTLIKVFPIPSCGVHREPG